MRQMRSATIGVLALLSCLDVSSAQFGGLGGLDTKAMRDAMLSARAKNAGVELEEDEVWWSEHMPFMMAEHTWTFQNWLANRKSSRESAEEDEEHKAMYRKFHEEAEAKYQEQRKKNSLTAVLGRFAMTKWGIIIFGTLFLIFAACGAYGIKCLIEAKAKRFYNDLPDSPFRRKPPRTVKVD